jgi:FkbM family methyltransferase
MRKASFWDCISLKRADVTSTDERGKPLGFKMHIKTGMELYRADTFYTKEPETIVWLDMIKPGSVLIDVGANIGVYSLYCASTKPDTHVYAFEPMLGNFTRLVDNILLNELHNITPINVGVGKNTALAKFFVKNGAIGESGSQLHAPIDEYGKLMPHEAEKQILTVTFDGFYSQIPNKRPTYLKIDVDGREWDVLEGVKIHAPALESVLVEVNTDQISIGEITAKMKSMGLLPDNRVNKVRPHSSDRRGGNPVNIVYSRPY